MLLSHQVLAAIKNVVDDNFVCATLLIFHV